MKDCEKCKNKESHGHCLKCDLETQPTMRCKCPERVNRNWVPNKEKWEDCDGLEALYSVCKSGVKIAIHNALASQRAELVEKLKGMKGECEHKDNHHCWEDGCTVRTDNYTLDMIITSLTEKGDE